MSAGKVNKEFLSVCGGVCACVSAGVWCYVIVLRHENVLCSSTVLHIRQINVP